MSHLINSQSERESYAVLERAFSKAMAVLSAEEFAALANDLASVSSEALRHFAKAHAPTPNFEAMLTSVGVSPAAIGGAELREVLAVGLAAWKKDSSSAAASATKTFKDALNYVESNREQLKVGMDVASVLAIASKNPKLKALGTAYQLGVGVKDLFDASETAAVVGSTSAAPALPPATK